MRMPPRIIHTTLRIMLNLELPFCASTFQRLAELSYSSAALTLQPERLKWLFSWPAWFLSEAVPAINPPRRRRRKQVPRNRNLPDPEVCIGLRSPGPLCTGYLIGFTLFV
jgi:hypothetical protein